MRRVVNLVLCGALFTVVVMIACTFKIDPVIEVNDAGVQVGPIYVCYDAGGQ